MGYYNDDFKEKIEKKKKGFPAARETKKEQLYW